MPPCHGQSTNFALSATAASSGPHVTGSTRQATDMIPKSTQCSWLRSVFTAVPICVNGFFHKLINWPVVAMKLLNYHKRHLYEEPKWLPR